MLEEMVKAIIKKSIASDYPHLKLPPSCSRASSRRPSSTPMRSRSSSSTMMTLAAALTGHITANWYEYTLTVLDRFGNPDNDFPTIPGIKSKSQFKAGAVVAVALPYGDLTPSIIGEVSL